MYEDFFYYWLIVDIFVNASGKFQNSSEIIAIKGSTFGRINIYFLQWDYFESYLIFGIYIFQRI